MPRTLARIFQRIWFINSEADMAENLGCAYDSINDFIEWGDIAVADEADMAVLNAFLVQIVSNAEDFMSPHQVACLTALILASYQDGPTRVSTLETAIGELLLWQEGDNPAAQHPNFFWGGGIKPLPLKFRRVSAKPILRPVPPLKSPEKLLTRISRPSMLQCLIVLLR